jgi:hypothetical protein
MPPAKLRHPLWQRRLRKDLEALREMLKRDPVLPRAVRTIQQRHRKRFWLMRQLDGGARIWRFLDESLRAGETVSEVLATLGPSVQRAWREPEPLPTVDKSGPGAASADIVLDLEACRASDLLPVRMTGQMLEQAIEAGAEQLLLIGAPWQPGKVDGAGEEASSGAGDGATPTDKTFLRMANDCCFVTAGELRVVEPEDAHGDFFGATSRAGLWERTAEMPGALGRPVMRALLYHAAISYWFPSTDGELVLRQSGGEMRMPLRYCRRETWRGVCLDLRKATKR